MKQFTHTKAPPRVASLASGKAEKKTFIMLLHGPSAAAGHCLETSVVSWAGLPGQALMPDEEFVFCGKFTQMKGLECTQKVSASAHAHRIALKKLSDCRKGRRPRLKSATAYHDWITEVIPR